MHTKRGVVHKFLRAARTKISVYRIELIYFRPTTRSQVIILTPFTEDTDTRLSILAPGEGAIKEWI